MARGAPSEIGSTRISPNGYHYTKSDTGWKLTHRLMMEAQLNRPLSPHERVVFRDGDKTNLRLGNLQLVFKKTASLRKRLIEIDLRIAELNYERIQLNKKIKQLEAGEVGSQKAS